MRCVIPAVLLAGAIVFPAAAADYPERPIRLVIGQAPGGATDIVARAFAARLSEELRQPVVTDNRAGAGGVIGAALVAAAAPDGYTLLVATNGPIAIAPHVMPKLAYRPHADFAPVGLFSEVPYVLVVHPSVKAATLPDFLALARSQPGKLHFGSSGQAGTPHLCGELLKNLTGIDIVHVPYRGGAPAQVDLVAGRVQAYCAGFPGLYPHIRAGKLRALAVAAPRRSGVMPEVPTATEAGVQGFEVSAWNGVLAPANTPRAVVDRLYAAIAALSHKAEFEAELKARGVERVVLGPKEFGDYIRRESARWARVVKAGRITSE
jgi:tripartite-type tricarboxylate transporter receptor subunit TctC